MTERASESDAWEAQAHFERRAFLVCAISATAAALLDSRVLAREPGTPLESIGTSADWAQVFVVMFPHPKLAEALYLPAGEALVAAADKDPATRLLLRQARRDLAKKRDWSSATLDERTAALASIEGTPAFALLRQTAVFTFYADPRVWAEFGYEGDAWRFGGYQNRVDTIDWLPPVPDDSAA